MYNKEKHAEYQILTALFDKVESEWSVDIDINSDNELEIQIENWSDAGEDLVPHFVCPTAQDFIEQFDDFCADFDADKHVRELIKSDIAGMPDSIQTLLDDANSIAQMYEDLKDEINRVWYSDEFAATRSLFFFKFKYAPAVKTVEDKWDISLKTSRGFEAELDFSLREGNLDVFVQVSSLEEFQEDMEDKLREYEDFDLDEYFDISMDLYQIQLQAFRELVLTISAYKDGLEVGDNSVVWHDIVAIDGKLSPTELTVPVTFVTNMHDITAQIAYLHEDLAVMKSILKVADGQQIKLKKSVFVSAAATKYGVPVSEIILYSERPESPLFAGMEFNLDVGGFVNGVKV